MNIKYLLLLLLTTTLTVNGNSVCSQHGTCLCDVGWSGESCHLECPGGSELPCSNHGLCLMNATCVCFNGFVGDACELECPGGSEQVCSDNGVCGVVNDTAVCECERGWNGEQCDQECPGGWVSPCSHHGECTLNNTCVCEADWVGYSCQASRESLHEQVPNVEGDDRGLLDGAVFLALTGTLLAAVVCFFKKYNVCGESKVTYAEETSV